MADDRSSQQTKEFVYHNIELYKSESLGSGSYGAVCKAKCDGLLCAAKIMHPILFDLHDPGTASYLSKFWEECQLLSLARHPNVVQYLGTCHDHETQLPIILMELCEESLTAYLGRSSESLSYHTQVDICHDIALALVYLHSNGLIHRDLTGNNVLMIAGPRAKITDFGMSKLASMTPNTVALTKCPGNVLYMSPEALDEAKSYTAKLDVFSLGVIIVQILTREFPNPTDRFRLVNIPEFDEPLRQLVPETERRKVHIKSIPDNHSLKSLALQCLKKQEVERPSALELSDWLSKLKQSSSLYRESKNLTQPNTDIQQLQQQLREQTEAKTMEVEGHLSHIAELEKLMGVKDQQLHLRDMKLQAMDQELQVKSTQLQTKERELDAKESEHRAYIIETKNVQLQEMEREVLEKQRIIVSRNQSLEIKEMELQQTKEQLRVSEQIVSELQQLLQQKEMIINNPQQTTPDFETDNRKLKQQDSETTGSSHTTLAPNGLEEDTSDMKWRKGKDAPEAMCRGAAVVYRNTAYFRPASSVKVFSYQNIPGEEQWSQLPDNPNKDCGLVVIDGLLTSVGGLNGSYTNKLLSLRGEGDKKQWCENFTPMPTPRYGAACVTTVETLVVAGGSKGILQQFDTVEAMDLETKHWITVSPLPQTCCSFSATICGDTLYLAGGVIQSFSSKSVFTCSLSNLVASDFSSSSANDVWKEASSLPIIRSTLVSFDNTLLAIGGEDDTAKPTSAVYRYDAQTDSWTTDSQMNNKRSACLAISIPHDHLIVVGGNAANTSDAFGSKIDSVEICTGLYIDTQTS